MACNSTILTFHGISPGIANLCSFTNNTQFYIDGSPTVIGSKIYTGPACDSTVYSSEGYYSSTVSGSRTWFYAKSLTTGGPTEITTTGQCSNCFSATALKLGTTYTFFNCCGQFEQVTTTVSDQAFNLDISKPYTGPISLVGPTTLVCPTTTPTPTPTGTPSITPTNTQTPTQTLTKTQTPSSSVTPSNSPVVRASSDCASLVIFPMEIECNVLSQPSTPFSSDGSLEILVRGGSPPYKITWQNGERNSIISGLKGGLYSVQVADYYDDYILSTTCELLQPEVECDLLASVIKATPTQTPSQTKTPTQTSTQTQTPTQTKTQTKTPTPTQTPTQTKTQTPTETKTQTPTKTPTQTSTPFVSPTATSTVTPTTTPTVTPTLPCFLGDYLVFTYEFPVGSGSDLDTISRLVAPTLQDPLGYCTRGAQPSGVYGGPYMFWGGDNTSSSGFESIYVDIDRVLVDFPAATTISFSGGANWYSSVNTGVINIRLRVFSGGTMSSDGAFGFTNTGGVVVADRVFPQSPITLFTKSCPTVQCIGTFSYNINSGCLTRVDTC